jgi:UDP:flavonoid glycosyltransferase YjiC (YdhE family)
MRFLFNSTGDYGHFHPLAFLANALVARGHEVRFGTEQRFADRVAAAGFEVVALPDRKPTIGSEEYLAWMEQFEGKDLITCAPVILGWFWQGAVCAQSALSAEVECWRPDVIVNEQTAWAGVLAARLAGLPYVTFHFRPAPPGILAALLGEQIATDLEAIGLEGDPSLVLSDPHLALLGAPDGWFTADEFGPTSRLIRPPLFDGGDVESPDWLDSLGVERPLVYVTMGTVFNSDTALFKTIIEALLDRDIDAVVTVGPKRLGSVAAEDLGELPGRIRIEEYLAQSLVLPRASAVVAHGGYGTLMGALEQGLPVACIPQAALDNQQNAQSLARLGAGVFVEEVSRAAIGAAITSVLEDPAIRSSARSAAESIARLPDADRAAQLIEEVAGR